MRIEALAPLGLLVAISLPAQQPVSTTVKKPPQAVPTKPASSGTARQPKVTPPVPPPIPEPGGDLQKLRAIPLPYRIERKGFAAGGFFKRVEIFWVPPTAGIKPRAYLVLASSMGRPRLPLEDQTWVQFAQNQGMGILSLGFDEVDKVSRLNESATDLGKKIYSLAEEEFGPNLKGAVIATGTGATWMHRVMMLQPWKWGFWCTRDVPEYPVVARGIEYPAGLLLATIPAQYDNDLFFFQEVRRAKVTNRIGFMAMDGKSVPASGFERIAQNYLLAMISGAEAPGRWHDIYSKADVSTMPKPPRKTVQNWVPGDEMSGAWKMLHQPMKKTPDCAIATADLKVPDLGKSLKVFFRIPGKTKEGAPVRAVQIWCVWDATEEALFEQLRSNIDLKSALWNRDKVGIVAINMNDLGIDQNLLPADLPRLEKVAKLVAPELWKVTAVIAAPLLRRIWRSRSRIVSRECISTRERYSSIRSQHRPVRKNWRGWSLRVASTSVMSSL
jgi:hypothetical protein